MVSRCSRGGAARPASSCGTRTPGCNLSRSPASCATAVWAYVLCYRRIPQLTLTTLLLLLLHLFFSLFLHAQSGKGGAVRKRHAGQSGGGTGGNAATGDAGLLRFYTDESPGLKIGPHMVLLLSLLFIAFVVILHIWGKFKKATIG
jgi:protein transport protein SEC61 subunit beta